MGSWAYCYNCEAHMEQPTVTEVVLNYQECPVCGRERAITDYERTLALENLLDSVKSLEERVAELEGRFGI